jgi:D-glutamate N-acetyltransferase
MTIQHPYLLFLGDAKDQLAAKTAQGVAHWRPEWCVGQRRLEGCQADLGLADMTLEEAWNAGAKTLVVGVANRGGVISDTWTDVLERALIQGFDLAAGLHQRLADVPSLAAIAAQHGRRLFDVRHPSRDFEVGNGRKRPGKRLLTVGTDCSVGKMYTSLALEREMRANGLNADLRATGQTGILIAGSGVSIDAVVADFISGAVEWISPANEPDHWDLIEGQGSLFHASYAGVSLGLLHGAQADALVLCHEPTRNHMRGLPGYPLPELKACIEANLAAARLTNPAARFVGVSVNTSHMAAGEAEPLLRHLEAHLDLPAVDAFKDGAAPILERLD